MALSCGNFFLLKTNEVALSSIKGHLESRAKYKSKQPLTVT